MDILLCVCVRGYSDGLAQYSIEPGFSSVFDIN